MAKTALRAFLVVSILSIAPAAFAGPYGDTLAKCLVSKTTSAQKSLLVQWMFATIGSHPEVKQFVAMNERQRDVINKKTATLFQDLLTETCVSETREALKYEGESTIETSFGVLGQVATRELFAHPDVNQAMSGMAAHLDEEKLREAFKEE